MEIRKIEDNKERFMDLLHIGDEQESMVWKYLERGDLFGLYDGELKTVCVVTDEGDGVCELKNIATYESEQGKGYAKALIWYVFDFYKEKFKTMLVGTGDDDVIISFYQSFGFVFSHKIKNFFVDNCDHPIFENGKQLVDMVYLSKDLRNKDAD